MTATAVNASLTTLYWRIGSRIRRDILREKRAEYGEEIRSIRRTEVVALCDRLALHGPIRRAFGDER